MNNNDDAFGDEQDVRDEWCDYRIRTIDENWWCFERQLDSYPNKSWVATSSYKKNCLDKDSNAKVTNIMKRYICVVIYLIAISINS